METRAGILGTSYPENQADQEVPVTGMLARATQPDAAKLKLARQQADPAHRDVARTSPCPSGKHQATAEVTYRPGCNFGLNGNVR